MLSALGSVLDRLRGFLNGGFLVAGILPALVFVGLNLVLLFWIAPASRTPIRLFITRPLQDQLLPVLIGLGLLLVGGYILRSLNPWLRRLLEGQAFPRWLQEGLIRTQHAEKEALDREVESLGDVVFAFRTVATDAPDTDGWKNQLREARRRGELSGRILRDTDWDLFETKLNACRNLRREFHRIPFATMEDLFQNLHDLLGFYSTSRSPNLDLAHVEFHSLLEYAAAKAERNYGRALSERRDRFPDELLRLGPSRLANTGERNREYGLRRYSLDVDVFWPRLEQVIRADKSLTESLEEAKIQLDFSVSMTVILGVITAVWSPVALSVAEGSAPFLVVFGLGGPLTAIFYQIVVRNYEVFTETLRSALDLQRFALLRALHLDLPADSNAERQRWEQVADWDLTEPLVYSHPQEKKPASAPAAEPPDALAEQVL